MALAGLVSAAPPAGHAQAPGLPVIGYLCPESPRLFGSRIRAFRDGLAETLAQKVGLDHEDATARKPRRATSARPAISSPNKASSASTGRAPGILLDWRAVQGRWEAYVVWADGGGNVKPRAYLEWVRQEHVTRRD